MRDITKLDYAKAHSASARMFERQRLVVPGGITHISRYRDPFPLFISRCTGAYKEDVDGNRYIDYWMGHGAMLLGHAEPTVVDAVLSQAHHGFHGSGETEVGLEWAERICSLVPSAEQARFTASGGEATQLAVRIARAATARSRLVKFRFGFHGWADQFTFGTGPEEAPPLGVPPSTAMSTVVLPYNDLGSVERCLREDPDIAAVILEPAGAFNDTVPVDPLFLEGLRSLTRASGVLLIFDEVVTGFRYSPGGAQEFFGVEPDLTTLGKVVSGGLPAGVVVGSSQLLGLLSKQRDKAKPFIPQSGTWNANPLVAAAGVATLKQIDIGLTTRVSEAADALRNGFNSIMVTLGIDGIAYGRSSIVKIYFGGRPGSTQDDFSTPFEDAEHLIVGIPRFDSAFERAMAIEGVDFKRTTGFVSSAHGLEEIARTVETFDRALRRTLDAVGQPEYMDAT